MTRLLTIRPATTSDVPAITAIYRPAVLFGTASFELEPPDEAEMGRRYAAVLAAGGPWLIAERDGAVLGYAYASPFRPRPAYRNTVEDSIYVAPDAQRGGVGRSLLARLIETCTAAGYRQMIAAIGDSAQVASIQLHQRAGFVAAGTCLDVGYKHGRWLDLVLMQRALGEGARTPPSS